MLDRLKRIFKPSPLEKPKRALPDWLKKDLECATPIIVDELSKDCKVRRIVLYGSYQKGTARRESDVDIGILVDSNHVWNRIFFGYEHIFPTDQDKYNIRRENELKSRLTEAVSQPDKLSLIYFTPQDLEIASSITARSPRGNVARAVLNGQTLFTDLANGWWNKGKGLKISKT